ncbi:MAG: hypothetical protein H7Y38_00195, partial [Armatimonadetes bacterium]|nr:hypothetical protein [Armatimonadota bacterium]
MNTKPSAQRLSPATGSAHPLKQGLRRSRSGASLVEVLIVLTIILIGVFIAIQIFPIGFTSLKRDEARLRADRLARNVTETLLSDQGALPEAISFSYYDAAGSLQTITDTDPDNLDTYGNSDAEIAQNKLYFSDVNKFRYVQNEPVAVPLATATGDSGLGGGIGSVHFLSFGPIYMLSDSANPARDVGNPTVAPTTPAQIALFDSYLKVTSEPLIR